MPLEPLPPENTRRVFVDYHTDNAQHTMMFRVAASASISSLQARISAFLTALAPTLSQITIDGVREAASGSTVTNPVDNELDSTYGTGTEVAVVMPRQLRFEGRSVDGRKVSISVYGYEGGTPDNYRLEPEENASVDAAIAELEANATFIGLTISGQPAVWKHYANVNFNSYWERQARG